MMLVTVEAQYVAQLRHAVANACGEWLEFSRVQPVPNCTLMRVWLGLSLPGKWAAMSAVMNAVPDGEIGPIQPL